MSTPTLYDINVTLMNLIFEREDIIGDNGATMNYEVELKRVDKELREHVTALVKKVDGVAYVLRELEAHAATAKAEKERQRDREHAFEARYERLETLVKSVMLMSGKARLDGDANTLRLVKCPDSVEIAQPELVPDEYQMVTVTLPISLWDSVLDALDECGHKQMEKIHELVNSKKREPSKSKIAEALKRGDGVPGCSLVQDKMSLRVE